MEPPRRRRDRRRRWSYCIDDVAVSTFTKRRWWPALRLASDGKVTTEVRTFQTTMADLLRLSEWLAVNGCMHVAMEATGVYWKPVWHILDDGEFALVRVNGAHVKNVGPQDRRQRRDVVG